MRIAIVNDLSLAREVLRRLVLSVRGYRVAWVADDGDEAITKAAADRPDVILMDLVMPRLNGVEATRHIMKASPCPILVVTATIPGHYELVLQAMGVGAIDAVETPVLGPDGSLQNAEKLLARLQKLDHALKGLHGSSIMVAYRATSSPAHLPPLVLLGVSTGGPAALGTVLAAFPANFPAPVLVAQHMDPEFVPGLVHQLAGQCRLPVRVATEGEMPAAGTVLVAATNDHLELTGNGTIHYTPSPKTSPWRPSVDVLYQSAGSCWPRQGVAALLTGMGPDGAEGLLRLRTLGWHTIAQDEATCVVYGMPKVAAEKQAPIEILPLSQIGPAIVAKILTAPKA
jgi:two-component system response regulator WspF